MVEKFKKEKSSNLITDWETNEKMSAYQREKSRTIEEDYLRKRYNKQEQIEPNVKNNNIKTFIYEGSVYIVTEETEVNLTGKRGNEIITILKGSV